MHDSPGPRLRPIVIRGARTHNLKSVDRHDRAAPADRRHRRQRLRQVVARLRHDLRRGAAPLRRVAVRLRAPVPRADGAARRRLGRGDAAGDRHPPEEQHPQPALDGRHHHRDARLPAPAVRAGRPDDVPAVRHGRRARDGRGRRRAAGAAARGRAPADRLRAADRPRRPARPGGTRREPGRRRPAQGRTTTRPSSTCSSRRRRPIRWPRPSTCCGARASRACSSTARRSASTTSMPPRSADRTSLEVIVDRIRVDAERAAAPDRRDRGRLPRRRRPAFAIELGAGEGGGPLRHVFSERFECRRCGIVYEVPQPRLFSFNNPFGACPTCHGFGNVMELDMGLVVPDPTQDAATAAPSSRGASRTIAPSSRR